MKVIIRYLLFCIIAVVLYGVVYAICHYYDTEMYVCRLTGNYEAPIVVNDTISDDLEALDEQTTIALDTNFIFCARKPIELPIVTTLESQQVRIEADAPVTLLSGESLMEFLDKDYPQGTKDSWHKRFIKNAMPPHIFQRNCWKAAESGIWFCVVPLLFLLVLGSFREPKYVSDVESNLNLCTFTNLITVPTLLWAFTGIDSLYEYYQEHNILLTIGLIIVGLVFLYYMLIANIGSMSGILAIKRVSFGWLAWLATFGCSFLGGIIIWYGIGVPNGIDNKSIEGALLVLIGMFIGGAVWASYSMIRQNKAIIKYLPELYICFLASLFTICAASIVALALLFLKAFGSAAGSNRGVSPDPVDPDKKRRENAPYLCSTCFYYGTDCHGGRAFAGTCSSYKNQVEGV